MNAELARSTQRSVDSVANIYAIVIGLALTQAIETLIAKGIGTGIGLDYRNIVEGVPAFISLLVTLVPFWHGMNRHLDRCYITKATASVAHQAILFDFFVFFIEAILLFVSGWALRTGLISFYCLGALLAVDVVWGFISHQIHFRGHKSHVTRWASINVVAIFVGYLVGALPFEGKPWALMVVALRRTIADYSLCSNFYFPTTVQKAPEP